MGTLKSFAYPEKSSTLRLYTTIIIHIRYRSLHLSHLQLGIIIALITPPISPIPSNWLFRDVVISLIYPQPPARRVHVLPLGVIVWATGGAAHCGGAIGSPSGV